MKKNLLLLVCMWVGITHLLAQDPLPLPQVSGDISVTAPQSGLAVWFSFTAPEDLVLSLLYCGTDSQVTVDAYKSLQDTYPSVRGSEFCDSKKFTGKGLLMQIAQGETTYIKVSTTQDISLQWSLKSIDLSKGETCDKPLVLKIGENVLPKYPNLNTYVSYTATKNELLVLQSTGASFSLEMFNSCEDAKNGKKETIYSDWNTKKIEIELTEGQTLLASSFTFKPLVLNVSTADIVPLPELPHSGKVAVKKATDTDKHRYIFRATSDCFVKISYCGNEMVNFTAQYKKIGYPDEYADLTCPSDPKTGKGIRFQVAKGDAIYVDVQTPKDIEIEVSTVEDVVFGGGSCDKALPLAMGWNFASKNPSGQNWFSYTAPQNEKLQFQFVEKNLIIYQHTSCEDTQGSISMIDESSQKISLPLKEGDQILIKMPNYKPAGFIVESEKILSVDGRNCQESAPLQMDKNHHSGVFAQTWYKHTATIDGNLIISTREKSNFEGYINAYSSCDNWLTLSRKGENGLFNMRLPIKKGNTYFIVWDDLANQKVEFDFWAEERKTEPGSTRELPLAAQLGENKVDLSNEYVGWYWYEYTPTQEGWLTATITHPEWNFKSGTVNFYDKSDNTPYAFIPTERDSLPEKKGYPSQIMTKKGVTYLIGISADKSLPNLSFTLAERPFATGDLPCMPLTMTSQKAQLTRRVGTEWYHFIAPMEGEYLVYSDQLPHWVGLSEDSNIWVIVGNCQGEPTASAQYNEDSKRFSTRFRAQEGDKITVGVFVKLCTPNVEFRYLTPKDLSNEVIENATRSLYPNPTTHQVFVRWQPSGIATENIEVLSAQGELLQRLENLNGEATVDLSSSAPGSYLIRLISHGKTLWVEKVIKE